MKNLSPINENKDVVTKEYVDPIKSQAAINRTTLGTQCKNLLKNTAVTTAKSGITFTVNSDGSVTVNGTNTSSGTTYIQLCGLVDYGNSKLIASIGQNTTDVYMAIYDSDWNWIGTGSAGTISFENSSKKRLVRLVVKPGVTINNVTFYPMLRYADISDDTYEPYQPSVQEQIVGAYFPMTAQKGIGDNTDLNTITELGNYICWSGSSASTMINCPTKAGGFRLIVTNKFHDCNYKSNIRYQWMIPNNQDSVLYYRRSFDTSTNSFGSWIAFRGKLYSALPGTYLGVAQSGSITIDNLSSYTALWVNVTGNVSGINFQTNLIVPVAYLAKSTSNSVQLAGGIPSSAYITSEGPLAAKNMDGTITAKVSGNTLNLTIGTGTIGAIEVVSLM